MERSSLLRCMAYTLFSEQPEEHNQTQTGQHHTPLDRQRQAHLSSKEPAECIGTAHLPRELEESCGHAYTWVLPAYMIRPHLLPGEAEEAAYPMGNEGVTRWFLTRAVNSLPDHLCAGVFYGNSH